MDYMVHTVASFFIVYHRPLWPNMLLFGFLVSQLKASDVVVVVISYCSELLIIAPRVSRKCFTNDSYHKTKYTVSNPFACLSHLLLQWHLTFNTSWLQRSLPFFTPFSCRWSNNYMIDYIIYNFRKKNTHFYKRKSWIFLGNIVGWVATIWSVWFISTEFLIGILLINLFWGMEYCTWREWWRFPGTIILNRQGK